MVCLRRESSSIERLVGFTTVIILELLCVKSACAAVAPDTVQSGPKYLIFDAYEFARDNSVTHHSACGFTLGYPLGDSKFVYEWQRPLVSSVKFRDRLDKNRVTVTVPAMFFVVLPVGLVSTALTDDTSKILAAVTYAATPFGSHIGYRMSQYFTAYFGIVPDVLLFTEQDGIFIQNRLGVRFDTKAGFAFNLGIQQSDYWGFETPSESLPLGFYLGVSFAEREGGWDWRH